MCIRDSYEPNANAKHLKQQANDGIALIVKGTQNMLFADILEQLQSVIEELSLIHISIMSTAWWNRLRKMARTPPAAR